MKVYRCQICGEVYIGEEKPGSCPFCGAHETYFVTFKNLPRKHRNIETLNFGSAGKRIRIFSVIPCFCG